MWLLILLFVVNVYILFQMKKPRESMGGEWIVYGTMGCGWTRKQLEMLKNKSIPFKFVDCDKENCGKIQAFPTLVSPIGDTHTGFKEF
jgi:hypothetical protein